MSVCVPSSTFGACLQMINFPYFTLYSLASFTSLYRAFTPAVNILIFAANLDHAVLTLRC